MGHWALFFWFTSLAVLTACGAQTAPPPTPADVPVATDEPTVRVAMLADVGGLDDASFNDLTFAGVSAVSSRLGLDFVVEEAVSSAAYQENIEAFAQQDFKIIVTVGIQMTEPTLTVAAAYPDIHFVGIDQFQSEPLSNVTGIVFADDQAGYLAGVLAANLTQSGVIGGVYGPDVVAPVVAFATGYANGARSVNENIEVLEAFHPGGVDEGFTDLIWGRQTAIAHMDANADVVFAAAGDTGNGAIVAVANQVTSGEGTFYCIGVDTDQWLTVREARPCLVTSAVKNIPQAIDDVIAQIIAGSAPTGNYLGPVGLAPYHDFEASIPEDLRAQITQIQEDLLRGTLQTGYTP